MNQLPPEFIRVDFLSAVAKIRYYCDHAAETGQTEFFYRELNRELQKLVSLRDPEISVPPQHGHVIASAVDHGR